ncbi:response regulator [Sphingobacteriaceae bacterium WQ 2009]|uniref:histidine kinase n=1 Tax=Rhinopithecimicrobium faecis TaxID=2820698 RepID=A0A8T4HA06_9SPHI|nr:response regulator [Sphingobacteriaceae bacterium WQ 2009]
MVLKKQQRNKLFRILLITLSFVLLLTIATVFNTQYRQYRILTNHIHSIYQEIQTYESPFSVFLKRQSEAENAFIRYVINLDSTPYKRYVQQLNALDSQSQVVQNKQLLAQFKKDSSLNILAKELPEELTTAQAIIPQLQKNLKILPHHCTLMVNQQHFSETTISTKNLNQAIAKNLKLMNDLHLSLTKIVDYENKRYQLDAEQTFLKLLEKANILKYEMIICICLSLLLLLIVLFYQYNMSGFEKRLLEEKHYAAQLAEDKTDKLTTISHEIRTPLNSLLGIIEMLKDNIQGLNKDQKMLIDSSYSSIRHTSKTINDILNISKINELSKIQCQETFTLWDTIACTIAMHQQDALLKNLQLLVSNEIPQTLIVQADELKIKQILINIISNAIKYSHEGTIHCKASIRTDGLLSLQVSDQGVGIPATMHRSIFRRYFTVAPQLPVNTGVGLGLYITKKLIAGMHGHIQVKSEVNKGSTFTINLPLTIVSNDTEPPEGAPAKKAAIPSHLSLLLVDDNPLNLLFLRHLLQDHDLCYTAKNGAEALAILGEQPIDLVITDLNMPEVSGLELLKKLRQEGKNPGTKVICTSSTPEQIKALEWKNELYFDEIIFKPFQKEELINLITKVLQTSERK